MDHPRRLLATILTGNTIVNTATAAIAALLVSDLAIQLGVNPNLAIAVEVVVLTIVIVFLSELAPKLLALRNPERWAERSSLALVATRFILSPISYPLSFFTSRISRLFGIERHTVMAMTEGEIRSLVEVGHEHGELEIEEREMIHSIFEFGDTNTREVMVPRIDIVAVEKSISLEELLKVVTTHGHSRIPVYDESIDNIIGLIHAKDLLAATQDSSDFDLCKNLRKAPFVPEEKKIDDLLHEFQSGKNHAAIVIDEYGGTAGLVTMEDIIEEIVGEIQDEYDIEQPLFKQVDEHTVIADGRIPTYEMNEQLGVDLIPEDESYDTLAGFVFARLGVVPHKGQDFEYEGYRFIVEEVSGKRIVFVKVIKERGVFEGN